MYRKCVTEVSARNQHQVAESLLALMQKMPYEDITVTQLCQSAGVSRRVFYHLFSNKLGALHALVDHQILGIESYSLEIPGESLRFVLYWKDQKDFLDALSENGFSGLLLERMVTKVLEEDYEILHGLQRSGWADNSKEVVIYGLSGLVGLIYSWHYSGFRQEPEELADLVERLAKLFYLN
ncbi:MAG: TetR/AcrR family transcriptional regulator [Oscillospiraceae bacterium]|nr:TetR/AcrR family transcriptional regulator [Oscillospiraceae bacterium]